ncbi:hypothetical protein QT327_04685 [Olivibacter sp. 47]|uniref:hypothetical protein n=1 Tax=Olivibacter sp. 47 TaxID=3056486 RepID=UPI0025A360AD|nr:hypothetical protein [Olivibacter sp. 47]MDM8173663.1 hypothetical protein [Olivibacter sp. 47]
MFNISLFEPSLNGISFNIINVTYQPSSKQVRATSVHENDERLEVPEIKGSQDFKTLLSGSQIELVRKLKSDLDVYLLISKEQSLGSEWHLVMPIIRQRSSGKIYEFSDATFALQGSGGGLGNMKSLLYNLSSVEQKGFNITISPKLIGNDILEKFLYVDNELTLDFVLKNSVDLLTYRKGIFERIYSQYEELINFYNLEHCF